LTTNMQTVHDAQTLISDLQWVRALKGTRNDEMMLMMFLLCGTSPQAPVHLSAELRKCLQVLGDKLLSAYMDRCFLDIPTGVLVVNHLDSPFALLCQWLLCHKEMGERLPTDNPRGGTTTTTTIATTTMSVATIVKEKATEQVDILEWVFLPHTLPRSVWERTAVLAYLMKKTQHRTVEISGQEPAFISLPLKVDMREWMLHNSEHLQHAFLGFSGAVRDCFLTDPCLRVIAQQRWLSRLKVSDRPIDGMTVYSNARIRTCKAACTSLEAGKWQSHIFEGVKGDSLQTLELTAVAWALTRWQDQCVNIVSDASYVVGVVLHIEQALLKLPQNPRLAQLFTG